MHVITRYVERRLKVHWSNQDGTRKNNNNTLELNDRSFENNRCEAEKKMSENTAHKQKQKKVYFLKILQEK